MTRDGAGRTLSSPALTLRVGHEDRSEEVRQDGSKRLQTSHACLLRAFFPRLFTVRTPVDMVTKMDLWRLRSSKHGGHIRSRISWIDLNVPAGRMNSIDGGGGEEAEKSRKMGRLQREDLLVDCHQSSSLTNSVSERDFGRGPFTWDVYTALIVRGFASTASNVNQFSNSN